MSVLALLQFEGADGSTTFTDGTGNQTWSIEAGTPEIDTAEFKAGAASGLFDGTGNILTTLATSLSGDFFVEGWFKFNSVNASELLFELDDNTGNRQLYLFYQFSNNRLYMSHNSFSTFITYNLDDGNWHHLALQRVNGDTYQMWVDGIREGSQYSGYTDDFDEIRIGSGFQYSEFNGWVDGFRVIDEQVFKTDFYGNPDPDPDLTYTVQNDPEIVILDPDQEFIITDQVITPVNTHDISNAAIFIDTEEAAAGPAAAGLQYWG